MMAKSYTNKIYHIINQKYPSSSPHKMYIFVCMTISNPSTPLPTDLNMPIRRVATVREDRDRE